MNTFIIVLLIILIILSGWNLKSLRDLKKYNKSKQEVKEDKYYELKYKFEYITSIVLVITAVGGFFGYKWFEGITKETTENIQKEVSMFEDKNSMIFSRLDSTKDTIRFFQEMVKEYRDTVIFYKNSISNLKVDQNEIEKSLMKANDTLLKLSRRINTINAKSIIRQNFYIVDNLIFPIPETYKPIRFYYKDLLTTSGDRLPKYAQVPFLFAVPENQVELLITHRDIEYFEIACQSSMGDTDTAKFFIMLSQR